MKKLLVTTALPYANGPIHLGHLLEQIQTDIWVRWQKLRGNDCIFISGDDAHGTPIMINAKNQGIDPEVLIANIKKQHENDFADFHIGFDNYYTTHSEENKELVTFIYQRLVDNDDIEIRTIEQTFDPVANMFLPDRFVKGTCPRCGAKDQYGDNCEVCGSTYATTDLIDPISTISQAVPIRKESEHYFFRLEKYEIMLKKWTQEENHLQREVANKLLEWFNTGLKQWDISRDAPYFGFQIPKTKDKYFYVWLDAPIGYIASFKNLCSRRQDLNFADYWQSEDKTELYQFMGKDIVYFHSLFWPAMLDGCKFRKPTKIFVHGYLTINGQKMSKSRGTFITVRDYLDNGLNPEYLRYYFASKLNNGVDDIDLNLTDFINKANSDLVGKIVNIASRCAGFITKNFDNMLSSELDNEELFKIFNNESGNIAKAYEELDYNNAIRMIMALADKANQYIDEQKPWVLAKQPESSAKVHSVSTMGLNLFRWLMIYLQPVLPKMAKDVEMFLSIPELTWNDLQKPLLNHKINNFTPLMQRVDADKVKALTA